MHAPLTGIVMHRVLPILRYRSKCLMWLGLQIKLKDRNAFVARGKIDKV